MNKINNKINNKGFTLIELLVTIFLMTLVTSIVAVSIIYLKENAEEKQNNITISNIQSSAGMYVEEFSAYWFEAEEENEEYACTTIGMLLNKGYLKNDVLNLKINDEQVNNDTNVKITRNATTKVYEKEFEIEHEDCLKTSDIKISFELSGNKNIGYENSEWYNDNVDIKLIISDEDFDQIKTTNYTAKVAKNKEIEINPQVVFQKQNWKIKVGEQGENIDVCVMISDLKGYLSKYCLSGNDLTYNMDKEAPTGLKLDLIQKDNNSPFRIMAYGARDNVSSNNSLVYYITDYENDSEISTDTRISNKEISAYVIDKAGNKSEPIIKTLNITDTKSGSLEEKFYCSLDNSDIVYDTEEDANTSCTNRTIMHPVSEKEVWKCNLNSEEYSSKNKANEECYGYVNEEISKSYYCNSGDTRNGDICTSISYEYVPGSYQINYMCYKTPSGQMFWNEINRTTLNISCPSSMYFDEGTSCNSPTYPYEYCVEEGSLGGEEVYCYKTCSFEEIYPVNEECYCSLTGSNSCDDECGLYKDGEVSSSTKYICSYDSSESSDKEELVKSCKSIESGNVSEKYWCTTTQKFYDEKETAIINCYCPLGYSYYENSCYSFK